MNVVFKIQQKAVLFRCMEAFVGIGHLDPGVFVQVTNQLLSTTLGIGADFSRKFVILSVNLVFIGRNQEVKLYIIGIAPTIYRRQILCDML